LCGGFVLFATAWPMLNQFHRKKIHRVAEVSASETPTRSSDVDVALDLDEEEAMVSAGGAS